MRIIEAKKEKAITDMEVTKRHLYERAAGSKVREKQYHPLVQFVLGESLGVLPMTKSKKEEGDSDVKGNSKRRKAFDEKKRG